MILLIISDLLISNKPELLNFGIIVEWQRSKIQVTQFLMCERRFHQLILKNKIE